MINNLRLLPLTKYLSYKVTDLTDDDLLAIADALKLPVPGQQLLTEVRGMLGTGDVDTVADFLARPGNLEKLKDFFSYQQVEKENAMVMQCSHCHNFLKLHFE